MGKPADGSAAPSLRGILFLLKRKGPPRKSVWPCTCNVTVGASSSTGWIPRRTDAVVGTGASVGRSASEYRGV